MDQVNIIDTLYTSRSLNFKIPFIDPTVYYNSYFGSGNGPVAFSYVYCQGWEADIHDCTKTVFPAFTCYSSNIAGVACKQGMYVCKAILLYVWCEIL